MSDDMLREAVARIDALRARVAELEAERDALAEFRDVILSVYDFANVLSPTKEEIHEAVRPMLVPRDAIEAAGRIIARSAHPGPPAFWGELAVQSAGGGGEWVPVSFLPLLLGKAIQRAYEAGNAPERDF